MDRPGLVGCSWIVAAVSPWAIAPHPNFSVKRVGGPELLALVADLQLAQFERYRERADFGASWERSLVESALGAIDVEHQASAIDVLQSLLTDVDLPIGARAAAALFASVALAERDDPEAAVALLVDLVGDVRDIDAPQGTAGLIESIVRQQLAVRLWEIDDVRTSMQEADAVQRRLASTRDDTYLEFPTSRGISWGSVDVQRDISMAVRSHALWLLASLEGLEGSTWRTAVTRKVSWPDVRADLREAEGARAFIAEAFDQELSAVSRTRRWFGEDQVALPVEAARMAAELSGNLGRIRLHRETRGRLHMVRPDSDLIWSMTEAIRLLRQARAAQPLEAALQWIRANGPLEALVNAVHQVMKRPSFPQRIDRYDIAVVASASDLLSREDLRAAIEAVRAFRARGRERDDELTKTPNWKQEDLAWQAIARLLPGSDLDNSVASEAASLLGERDDLLQILSVAFARLANVLNWQSLSDGVVDQWRQWSMSHLSHKDLAGLARLVLEKATDMTVDSLAEAFGPGLGMAEYVLAQHQAGRSPEPANVEAAAEACVSAMRATASDASRGRFSQGGRSEADLAVALASAFELPWLWSAIIDYITDSGIARYSKSPALDRMAVTKPPLTSELQERLRAALSQLIRGEDVDPFGDELLPIMPAALRAATAFSAIEREQAVAAIAELAGMKRVDGRVEAARSVPIAVSAGDGTQWAAMLLLQLSHDEVPVVRAEAGRALALCAHDLDELSSAIRGRMSSLLAADGILVPLLTLRGFDIAARRGSRSDVRLYENRLRAMREGHLARPIRELAGRIIARVDQR